MGRIEEIKRLLDIGYSLSNDQSLFLFSRLQIAEEENKLYKDWYMNTHHFDETGCEYLTIVDGKCVSCNRPIPKALEQIQKEE